MPGLSAPASARAFQQALLGWYRRNARPLPWRTEPSLYKTVVSEFMLQQTQVATVLPYFARWLQRFPGFQALADAPADQVLKCWEGLGYYSRARNLHRLAQAVATRPEPPQDAEGWEGLPGVGPYTAAAIASIALGEPVACVDGNIVRILARLTADGAEHRDSASAAKTFRPLAAALLSRSDPGDHNQAMMELGATVCTRRNPRCDVCPVSRFCDARPSDPEAFPKLAAKRIEDQSVTRVWCERNGALLLHLAKPGARRLSGLHELPGAAQLGLDATELERLPVLAIRARAITRFRIRESIVQWIHPGLPDGLSPSRQIDAGMIWMPISELDRIALSGPHRRWIEEILAGRRPPGTASAVKPSPSRGAPRAVPAS